MEGYFLKVIEYRDNIDGILPENLIGFFEGWANKPSTEKHLEILKNSSHIIIALDAEKVIGFINAVTDKALSAYIPLVEVLPEYRNKGIGSELVKRMIDKLSGYYMIDICCDERLEHFYKRLGMKKVTGMILRNYDKT